jgi:hypothetical protein
MIIEPINFLVFVGEVVAFLGLAICISAALALVSAVLYICLSM